MQDLSIVTDTLIAIVTQAVLNSPLYTGHNPHFAVNISGQHPETPSSTDCELSVYLFHISADKFLANQFWTQQAQHAGKQAVAFEPLSLDLWYMLSAQSKSSYVNEQLVLGLAMEALHQHGTFQIQAPTPPPNSVVPSEATLVLESPTFDEMSRLWQALGIPLRTTAQYRVSVVFLTPDDRPPAAQPPVQMVQLDAAPAGPITVLPKPVGTYRTLTYTAPGPSAVIVQQSPASTAPAPVAAVGQTFTLDALGMTNTDHVQLVSYDAAGTATQTDITATWKLPGPVPFKLRPPEAPPTPPGRYELVITRPATPTFRSNGVPLNVGPWINPAGGPLLNPNGGIYTLDVRNVPAAGAALRIGAVQLDRVAAGTVPAPGQWQCSGTQITFSAPTDLPSGHHQIGLRAGDVEADPALWAVV